MLKSPSARPPSTTLPAGQSWFSQSKSGKPITSSPPVVTVVTRVVSRPKPKQPRPAVSPSPATCSSASSSRPVAVVTRKRKPADDAAWPSKAPKKPRVSASRDSTRSASKGQPRDKVSTLVAEQIFRQSRSRSASVFPTEPPVERKCWSDSDGTVGEGFISCEKVVKGLMHSYKAFFRNPRDTEDRSFEPDPTNYPHVDLEYPNDKASERFILLEPKDKDHYNPIMCLEETLHTIIEFFLTPAQQCLFGTLPNYTLSSPSRSAPNSQNSSSSLSSLTSLGSEAVAGKDSDSSSLTSLSDTSSISVLSSLSSLSSNFGERPADLLRSLSRAIHLRDGPLFLSTMRYINGLLRILKCPASGLNPLREVPKTWTRSGIPHKLLMRIIEETYQRSVGPNVGTLKKYSAFSSEVYGELMPAFTSDIIAQTGLRAGALFVDLGSGVGNVVMQAALQTGCSAFGVELMKGPAGVAEVQLKQFRMRCAMWGVASGEVELLQGDMTDSRRVDELMAKADVVLVNNFVFREELNAALRPKFLDLKEGAIVVSLKPFAPPTNQRLTERNIDDISAIFEVTTRAYHSGTVSWSSGSGHYYIHRVDRAGYQDCREQFERVHSRLRRSRQ